MVTLAAFFLGGDWQLRLRYGLQRLHHGCYIPLCLAGCLFVALLAPVVPSFRTLAAHFAIHEEVAAWGAMDRLR